MGEVSLKVLDAIDAEFREVIYSELRAYNREHNGGFYAAIGDPANAAQPLFVAAVDSQQRPLGGLFAETQLAWLKIDIMAVRSDARRLGVGRMLLETAEKEAIRRGCRHAVVDTMDYQAPAFYQKLGYQTVGRLDDWDSAGHAKLYLVKSLA